MLLELWGCVAPIWRQLMKGKGLSPGAMLEEAAPLGGRETSIGKWRFSTGTVIIKSIGTGLVGILSWDPG